MSSLLFIYCVCCSICVLNNFCSFLIRVYFRSFTTCSTYQYKTNDEQRQLLLQQQKSTRMVGKRAQGRMENVMEGNYEDKQQLILNVAN